MSFLMFIYDYGEEERGILFPNLPVQSPQTQYCGLTVFPQNSYVQVLTPNVTVPADTS